MGKARDPSYGAPPAAFLSPRETQGEKAGPVHGTAPASGREQPDRGGDRGQYGHILSDMMGEQPRSQSTNAIHHALAWHEHFQGLRPL